MSRLASWRTALLVVGLSLRLGGSPAAGAEPGLAAEALTVGQAVGTALARNRDILAARLDIETAQYDRAAASVYPNPVISYNLGNIVIGQANPQYPPIPQPGAFGQTQHNIAISEVVDIWAKRTARIRAAEEGIVAKRLLVEDALREVVYQVRTGFMDALRAQEARELARETNARYAETVRISRSRFAAGDISENELRKIELESLRYQTAVIDAESELDLARQKLAALLGFAAAEALPPALAHATARTAAEPLPALLERAAQQRPDLLAARQSRAASAATLSSAQREALPDISVSLNYQHSEFTASGDNPNSLGLGVSFPLPLFDRNQASVGRARVDQKRAENSIERIWLLVQQDVAGAARRVARAQLLLDAFEAGGMSERAEAALRVAEHAYKAGAASLLELLEAQRTYLDTRAQYLRAQHEYRQSLVEVSHAVAGDIK
jgi:cobalt-zinc-cadmium efflux system outer membrane protein